MPRARDRSLQHGPQPPGELEWVDAELDDGATVGDVDISLARDAGAATAVPPSAGALETLRADAVRRLRRWRRRATSAAAGAAWASWPLGSVQWCVIDLETTGVATGADDDILEIGAVQVERFELGREFETLIDPRRPISGAAQRVHGIDARQIVAAPRIEQALPWLLETVRDRVLVFHNAGFDSGFLQRALVECGREPFAQPVFDTLVLARRALAGRCALSVLATRLGIEAPRPHRALADARTTAQLLVELLALCKRAGATTLGEVPALFAGRTGARGRKRARFDPLLERLDAALRCGETLEVSYHAGSGMEPLALRVRPRRLHGGMQLECDDELSQRPVVLEVMRIRSVHRARSGS